MEMSPTANGFSSSAFRPVLIKTTDGHRTESEYASDGTGEPAIETEWWTGNFTILRLYPVWWQPNSPPEFYQARYQVRIDSISALNDRERYLESNSDDTVTLYRKPESTSPVEKRILIARDSRIQFLDACKD